jgi:3-phosphoshikimate 1-carboxyvinyltransferase
VEIDGSISSQFITGLLLALPHATGEFTLRVKDAVSTPYLDMTIDTAQRFGVEILHNGYTQFYIEGGQHYRALEYSIEGDWSAAAPLLVAGAIAGEVTLNNISSLSKQADTAVCTALERAGAELIHEPNRITVAHRALRAFNFDATQCPDLFPPLVALAAACTGESTLKGTSRLTHKESNRALTLQEEYQKLGIEIDLSTPDLMRIRGGEIHAATVHSHGDHRIAMSLAVSALRSATPFDVEHAEAIDKSYPRFFDDLAQLLNRQES